MFAVEWSLFDRAEEIDTHFISFPTEVKNRHRETRLIHNQDELFKFVDCDSRYNTVQNLLAARFDDKIIKPESLISTESMHMLNHYATQRRFGMCYLFPSVADCPIGVQICFDAIAAKAEQFERDALKPKRQDKDNGHRTSRTNSYSKD